MNEENSIFYKKQSVSNVYTEGLFIDSGKSNIVII